MWFGVVVFKVQVNRKCYCGNLQCGFCGKINRSHFNVIMVNYIPYFILWLWCRLHLSTLVPICHPCLCACAILWVHHALHQCKYDQGMESRSIIVLANRMVHKLREELKNEGALQFGLIFLVYLDIGGEYFCFLFPLFAVMFTLCFGLVFAVLS